MVPKRDDEEEGQALLGANMASLRCSRSSKAAVLALLVCTLVVGALLVLPQAPGRLSLPRLRAMVLGFGRSPSAEMYAARSSGSAVAGKGIPQAVRGGGSAAHSSGSSSGAASTAQGEPGIEPPEVQQEEPEQEGGEEQQPARRVEAEPWYTPLSSWQEGEAFYAPRSGCTIHPDGSVSYDTSPSPASGMPFLFDVNQFASTGFREHMCGKGIDDDWRGRYRCFAPCIFETRLCDTRFPGQYKSQAMLARYHAAGWSFWDFSPCELFQRIRGRTLWFMGDSQTGHFYFAAECFLREFALQMNRTAPFPRDINKRLNIHDPPILPACIELLHNTRVCRVRIDYGQDLTDKMFPLMLQHYPDFANDIVLFNFGLHYGKKGEGGYLADIARIIKWRQERRAEQRPLLVWMDVPMQHFDSPTGKFHSRLFKEKAAMRCKNLTAWYQGDPLVVSGGKLNIVVGPHIPVLADAHLCTWNASAPLWDMHMPGECTHYCGPSAYHLWLWLLNSELARSRVGAAVRLRPPGRAVHSSGEVALAAAAAKAAAPPADVEVAAAAAAPAAQRSAGATGGRTR